MYKIFGQNVWRQNQKENMYWLDKHKCLLAVWSAKSCLIMPLLCSWWFEAMYYIVFRPNFVFFYPPFFSVAWCHCCQNSVIQSFQLNSIVENQHQNFLVRLNLFIYIVKFLRLDITVGICWSQNKAIVYVRTICTDQFDFELEFIQSMQD